MLEDVDVLRRQLHHDHDGAPRHRRGRRGGGFVFWTECAPGGEAGVLTGGLYRCPATGCTSAPSPVGTPGACTIATTYDSARSLLYWGDVRTVRRCSPATCEASEVTLATGQYGYVSSIATSDAGVFWLESVKGLSCCTSPTCTPAGSQVVASSKPLANTTPSIAGSFAYWTTYVAGSVAAFDPKQISLISSTGGTVVRARLDQDGGSAETLVANGSHTAVVADAKVVRFTDFSSGAILSCPLEGCGSGPTIVADGQGQPFALMQDETAIYWANWGGGQIMKLAK